FGLPHKQGKTDFIFEVVYLAGDARLRDVKLQRRARDILLFRHSNEVTEMAQFHFGIITISYKQSRITVFLKAAICADVLVTTSI
ncbi:MAG TPA: hypothetical protein VE860_08760, partial [Chthoniobacterales bacterium]|nr:hypothetical protein [Chthoniobacterales bacterium]